MSSPEILALHDISLISNQKKTNVTLKKALFEAIPSQINFRNYEAHQMYEQILRLRNIDEVPRSVHVIQNENPYFKIKKIDEFGHKVASGLCISYVIQFKPDGLRDYYHDLMCVTDRELFTIPIHCTGPRATLNIPKEINFGFVMVKTSVCKFVTVHNVGNTIARINMKTESPFEVDPVSCSILPDEKMNLKVSCTAKAIEEVIGNLEVLYDTGEKLIIVLKSQGSTADISINPNKLIMDDCFIGLFKQSVVKIFNNSSEKARFKWTTFKSLDEEEHANASLLAIASEQSTNTSTILDPKLSQWMHKFSKHAMSYPTRIHLSKSFPFTLEPVEGELWPHSSKEIAITFSPEQAKVFEQYFYCDITGCVERLQLHLIGQGLGPVVKFSFTSLDIGNVFIGARHSYELVLSNNGCIDAMYSIQASTNPFSKCFTLTPDDGLICPGSTQAIQIEFYSNCLLGKFEENFEFLFDGCETSRCVQISGAVVGPTFHFNLTELEFDKVSYGFSQEKVITLQNTAFVPMQFVLRMVEDRPQSSGPASENSSDVQNDEGDQSVESAEFQITPDNGILEALNSLNIGILYAPISLGCKVYRLIVDVIGVGENQLSIPVKVESIRPVIKVRPEKIQLERCFLHHPYIMELTLINDSEQPAKYELLNQVKDLSENTEKHEFIYFSPSGSGNIDGLSSKHVPITIKPMILGPINGIIKISICDIEEDTLEIPITGIGEGPVLYVEETALDWGCIPVLQASTKTIVISNESTIPASFVIQTIRPDSIFRSDPQEAVIESLGQLNVQIIAFPDDVIPFRDKLQISIENNPKPLQIDLCATGQGGTIVTEPVLSQMLNLGSCFSNNKMQKTIRVTNRGRRQQQLIWSIEGQMNRKTNKSEVKPTDIVWSIRPHRFDINPSETIEITLEVFSSKPQILREKILCHTIIGRGAKTLIKSTDVTVEFIAPLVEFSDRIIVYRVEKLPSDELEMQFRNVSLKNTTNLPLTCKFKLCYPFQIISDGIYLSEMTKELKSSETVQLTISFDPAYKDDLIIRRADELLFVTYEEHPQTDAIRLVGEVYFPNLNFDSDTIDFGFILNHTEVTRHLIAHNPGPITVQYRWSFLVGNRANVMFRRQAKLSPRKIDTQPIREDTITQEDVPQTETIKLLENAQNEQAIRSVTDECDAVQSMDPMRETNTKTHDCETDVPNLLLEEQVMTSLMNHAANSTSENIEFSNEVLENLLELDNDVIPLGIEEIFDVTPLYGEILPGAKQPISFTFFGHADIEASVTAICDVEGGPTYELEISGGASQIEYSVDQSILNLDSVFLDKPALSEFNLINMGEVGFHFTINLLPEANSVSKIPNGQLIIETNQGYLAANASNLICLCYEAFKPGWFERKIEVRVAHFPPTIITVKGLADFAHLNLNLPRYIGSQNMNQDGVDQELDQVHQSQIPDSTCRISQKDAIYYLSYRELESKIRQRIRETITQQEEEFGNQSSCSCKTSLLNRKVTTSNGDLQNRMDSLFLHSDNCPISEVLRRTLPQLVHHHHNLPNRLNELIPDLDLQLEAEHDYVCTLLENEWHSTGPNKEIHQIDMNDPSKNKEISRVVKSTALHKMRLPAYILDFGYVVHGDVVKRNISAINTNSDVISFRLDTKSLNEASKLGFTTNISRIRHLPGAPDHDPIDWEIMFDSRAVSERFCNLVEAEFLIYVSNGPSIPVHLRANIVTPILKAHTDNLDFGKLIHGEARLLSVQLHNPSVVPVSWYWSVQSQKITKSSRKATCRLISRSQKTDSHRKMPPYFEILPSRGMLEPGSRTNIQVKFTPIEEKRYEETLRLNVENSNVFIKLHCCGYGLEPKLEFDQALIQFKPTQPYTQGVEETITVSNPCDFPIEFYSLEYDPIIAHEDEVLRSVDGYNEFGFLLLPPRRPGESLPPEILNYYEEQFKRTCRTTSGTSKTPEQKLTMNPDVTECYIRELKGTDKRNKEETLERSKSDIKLKAPEQVAHSQTMESIRYIENQTSFRTSSTMDITPVTMSIARYLGIDLTSETKVMRKFVGIALIVHGPLNATRQDIVYKLSQTYQAPILSMNEIVLEALAHSSSESAQRARDICLEVGQEILRGNLSETEQLNTNEQLNRVMEQIDSVDGQKTELEKEDKTSIQVAQNKSPIPKSATVKPIAEAYTNPPGTRRTSKEADHGHEMLSHSPPPLGIPSPRLINLDSFLSSEKPTVSFMENQTSNEGRFCFNDGFKAPMYSTVLPDDLILNLLEERFTEPDCQQGLIINGLDSNFTENRIATLQLILKSLKDRPFIYHVTTKVGFSQFKSVEQQLETSRLTSMAEAELTLRRRAEEITELEYLQLDEEERNKIDEMRLQVRREKRQKELEAKRLREIKEREEQEAEAKRLELERMNKRKGKKTDDKQAKANLPQINTTGAKDMKSVSGRLSNRSSKISRDSVDHQMDPTLLITDDKRRISRAQMHHKSVTSIKEEAISEDKAPTMSDEDRALYQRFKTFDVEFQRICSLLSYWDRQTQTKLQAPAEREDSPGSTLTMSNKRIRAAGSSTGPIGSRVRQSTVRMDSESKPVETIAGNIRPLSPKYCNIGFYGISVSSPSPQSPHLPGSQGINETVALGIPHLILDFTDGIDSDLVNVAKHELSTLTSRTLKSTYSNDLTMRCETKHGINSNLPDFYNLLISHLPHPNQILDYFGIGPSGPPIPEPVNFSVVRYPSVARSVGIGLNEMEHATDGTKSFTEPEIKSRSFKSPNSSTEISGTTTSIQNLQYFQFLYSGCGDPIVHDRESVDSEVSEPIAREKGPELIRKSAGRGAAKERRSPRQKITTDTNEPGQAPTRKQTVTSRSQKSYLTAANQIRRSSGLSTLSETHTSRSDDTPSTDTSQSLTGQTLTHFRWIVPPKGQIRLRLRFRSDQLGQYDQLFNFEILGSRRLYQVYCRGLCALPTLSREPRLVFQKRQKALISGEIPHRIYIMDSATFEFGPLLVEKTKDRVKEGYYPENMATFTLINTSPMEADVKLGFLKDAEEECFSLEPSNLLLVPNQFHKVNLWAFPRTSKRYEDAVVCAIKDNPEPVVFKIACDGVLPELEMDKKAFNFDKVLLQRKEVRSITLRNPTLLPVQWKLSGIESLGDEFSISQNAGVIEPKSDFIVHAYFRAMKPVKSNQKKSLRLEVYDLENLAGLIQVETIQVTAEAYDVALDISFPKGSDGGLDFGLMKVGEEAKQTMTLKNKGPYEITVSFALNKLSKTKTKLNSIFTIAPERITLTPTDKSGLVTFTVCTHSELVMKEEEILRCLIYEPNAKSEPELIASIPIKVSVKAVFSKFTISPLKEINFGALILHNRKTRQLVIENNGDYEFKIGLTRMIKMRELVAARESSQPKDNIVFGKQKVPDSNLICPTQNRLQLGFFTIVPACGVIPPGNALIINVECAADEQIRCEEELAIEITDRDTSVYRYGVPYNLVAEGHIPSIETNDISTIFEEHMICRDLSFIHNSPSTFNEVSATGVYGIEENRFVFVNALIGSHIRARFRIANRGKVPAEVSFELRKPGAIQPAQTTGRSSSRNSQSTSAEAFELEPDKALIEPHSSVYVNLTFSPSAMQMYSAIFCVYLDNRPVTTGNISSSRGSTSSGSKQTSESRVLSFDVVGEGNLPRLRILEPATHSRNGQTMCIFKRIQVGRVATKSLLLKNDGVLNSRVNIDLVDPDGVFLLQPEEDNDALLFYNPHTLGYQSIISNYQKQSEINNVSNPNDLCYNHDGLTVINQSYLAGLVLKPGKQFLFTVQYRPIKTALKSLGQIRLMVVNNSYEDSVVELMGESLADEVCLEDLPQLESDRYEAIQAALLRARSAKSNTQSSDGTDSADFNYSDTQTTLALRHNHLDFGDISPNDYVSRTFTMSYSTKFEELPMTSIRFAWPTNHPNLQFRPSEGHLHPGQSHRIVVTFQANGAPVTMQLTPIKCTLHRIMVPIPEGCDQAPDWDDSKQIIRWVDAPTEKFMNHDANDHFLTEIPTHKTNRSIATPDNPNESGIELLDQIDYGSSSKVIRRKQKVIETEPEPHFDDVPDIPDPKPLELLVSAVAAYSKFHCDITAIEFADTLMLERRIYKFRLSNPGLVSLHYSWSIEMVTNFQQFMGNQSSIDVQPNTEVLTTKWDPSLIPFRISPDRGYLLPGKFVFIEVTFCPLIIGEFEAQLIGQLENLAKSTSSNQPVIKITGKSEQPFMHFELVESDYLSGGFRNPELPGPMGSPIGFVLDSATRVIEITMIGIGKTVQKHFFVINLTNEDYEFTITNEDSVDNKGSSQVECLIPQGIIRKGERCKLGFQFTSRNIGLTESFWRLNVEKFQFSVPLLIVGQAKEPIVTFDCTHINFKAVLVGHTVTKTIYLINHGNQNQNQESDQSLEFRFVEVSCHSPGKQDSVCIEPMLGKLQPNSRFPIQVSFTSSGEREVNINVHCKIKHRLLPLSLNVKAQGYTVSASVWMENLSISPSSNLDNQIELQSLWSPCIGLDTEEIASEISRRIAYQTHLHQKLKTLEFGEIDPGECITRKITLINCGRFKFDYAFKLSALKPPIIEIHDENSGFDTNKIRLIDRLLNGVVDKNINPVITISPSNGSIQTGEKQVCKVVFKPPKQIYQLGIKKLKLDGLISLCLAIRDGPAYGFQLTGSTRCQSVQFSAETIDFGPHLLSNYGLKSPVRYLYLTNSDGSRPMSIECVTQNSEVFQHNLVPTLLKPKQSQSESLDEQILNGNTVCMTIAFSPKACKIYEETFTFEINGSSLYSVKLVGKGTKLKLQTDVGPLTITDKSVKDGRRFVRRDHSNEKQSTKLVNLGLLKLDQASRRFVTLVNQSSVPIYIHQVLTNTSSQKTYLEPQITSKHRDITPTNINTDKFIKVKLCNPVSEELQTTIGSISELSKPVLLGALGGKVMIEIMFDSEKRLAKFAQDIVCELSEFDVDDVGETKANDQEDCINIFLPILTVTGALETYDISFDSDVLTFGSVVQGSQLTKRLNLVNAGDLGAKFRWDVSSFGSEVNIKPLEGFIAAGMDVPFEVTLSPTKLVREFRLENITCNIEGWKPKTITITGTCISPTVVKDVQTFSTNVRQQETRIIQIINRTSTPWFIRPIIDGSQWSGPKLLEVPEQQTVGYELVYQPMVMTLNGAKHKGSIFFPLPDGTGLLYNLVGTSDPPKPIAKITREVESRKSHTEMLVVPNWLNESQRFRVTREFMRPDKTESNTTLKGLNYIDVPANGSRTYKFTYCSYREGSTLTKVTFTNDSTGEYQYYEILFKTVKSRNIEIIRMQTPVRKPANYQLRLENPLQTSVNFVLNATLPEIQCPSQMQIPPTCKGIVSVEFLPLRVGSYNGRLEASCTELGTYSFDLVLQATQPGPEAATHFKAAIGQRHLQSVKFTNLARTKTEFTCTINNPEFHCDKIFNAAPGIEANIDVIFEPTSFGTKLANLNVSSPQAGDYVFPLKGIAIPPQPQGPITIKSGETKHITFKNVFSNSILYSFQVDNTNFHLPKQSEIIRPSKEFRIPVGLDQNMNKSFITGKLIVTLVRIQSSTVGSRRLATSSSGAETSSSQMAEYQSAQDASGLQWVYYLRGVPS